jgi:beta-glucanase (GH16 family)
MDERSKRFRTAFQAWRGVTQHREPRSAATGILRTMDWLIAARRPAVGIAAAALGLTAAALGLTAAGPVYAARGHETARQMPRGNLPGWQRVFADDFKYRLNPARWGRYQGQPGDSGGWWEPSHVVVRRGLLSLETYRDQRFGGRWVSGGVSSSRGLKQTYGKYEVRFRMDRGKGVAGILLLMPVADHWPPEIDFAESGGARETRRGMSATLHYGSENSQIQRSVRADFTRWHRMGVEWSPGKLAYTLDGRRWASVRSPHVPDEPMELDIQAQAGTCGDEWAPCPDASTPSQVNLQVDWVVAYAYRPGSRG